MIAFQDAERQKRKDGIAEVKSQLEKAEATVRAQAQVVR